MATASRRRDYLLRRPGSSNWLVRLRDADGRRFLRSLGTSDKAKAEIIAWDLIREHKARVLAARPRFIDGWHHKLESGREHAGENGERIIATDKELIVIGHNGSIIRTEPNGCATRQLLNMPMGAVLIGDNTPRPLPAALRNAGAVINLDQLERPKAPTKGDDDEIIEAYIRDKKVTGYYERECRAVWETFRALCDKPLKDCDRDDAGRALYKHYKAQPTKNGKPPKDASVRKKIMWLVAAVNYAMEDRKQGDPLKLKYNPFANAVPTPKHGEKSDSVKRLPFDADDTANIKANLDKLSESDQLLFRMTMTTGMRPSEAFRVTEEENRSGSRCVTIGTKTENSVRTIPFPEGLLRYLPAKIKGPLFCDLTSEQLKNLTDDEFKRLTNEASKRLNGFLREIGIKDPRKVAYSSRHRAKDRLRDAECDSKLAEAIFGREKGTRSQDSGDGYGEGYSMKRLKKWIDKIGF